MKIVIIGNGVAGQTTAETIRKVDKNAEIILIGEETHPYYTRINLPHYIAGEKKLDELYMRKISWYGENNVDFHHKSKATKIDPQKHFVFTDTQANPISYDKLMLATGSSARKLPYNKPNIEGMFTLRNITDADSISAFINKNNVKRAIIIGGGLLGIELGYHLLDRKLDVTICEILPYLLPRQLDKASSKILQKYLESKNIHVVVGEEVAEIIGDLRVTGLKTKSGKSLSADIIFQQMGIIPNLSLAKEAGLKIEKGIVCNEYLQSSDPDIYAAGDCVQFKNLIWGIIPASLEQSKIAALHMIGQKTPAYEGTFWNTRLKIAGINLSCFGSPPQENSTTEQVVENMDEGSFLCRKIVLENETLKGAILMSPTKYESEQFFLKNVGKKISTDEVKLKLKK